MNIPGFFPEPIDVFYSWDIYKRVPSKQTSIGNSQNPNNMQLIFACLGVYIPLFITTKLGWCACPTQKLSKQENMTPNTYNQEITGPRGKQCPEINENHNNQSQRRIDKLPVPRKAQDWHGKHKINWEIGTSATVFK